MLLRFNSGHWDMCKANGLLCPNLLQRYLASCGVLQSLPTHMLALLVQLYFLLQ